MKRRIFSVVTALALCLSLLPGTVWAAANEVTVAIGGKELEPGKSYDSSLNVIEDVTGQTDYLDFAGAELTVHGNVAITGDMTVSGGMLTVAAENDKHASFTLNRSIINSADAVVSLAGQLSLTVENGVCNGALRTEDGYDGAVELKAEAGPAVSGTDLDLKTANYVTITGNSSSALVDSELVNISAFYVTIINRGTGPALECDSCAISTAPTIGNVFIISAGEAAIDCPSIDIPGTYYDGGKLWIDGGELEAGHGGMVSPNSPGYSYTAGGGRIFYDYDGDYDPDYPEDYTGSATLTLENASYEGMIILPNGLDEITIVPKGSNHMGLIMSYSPVTVTGGGDLDAFVEAVTYNAEEDHDYLDCKVYGDAEWPEMLNGQSVGANDGVDVTLTISSGATLKINDGDELTFSDLSFFTIAETGKIENNGTIFIEEGAVPGGKSVSEAIKDLHLTGDAGKVVVTTDEGEEFEYPNDGETVIDKSLDFTDGDTPSKGAGYTWDGEHNILTLDNVAVTGTVTLPDDTVTIYVIGDCGINKLTGGSSPNQTKLTISGTGKLTVTEEIGIVGGDHNSLTVDACLEARGGIGIGASGSTNSTVTVNGTLIAKGGDWIALNAGRVIVGSTGTLEVSGKIGVSINGAALENTGNGGNSDFADAFCLEEGGVFRADCGERIISIGVSYEFLRDQVPDNAADEGTWLNDNIQEIIKRVVNILPGYLPDGVEVMGTLAEGENGGSWTAEVVYIADGDIIVSKNNVKYAIEVVSGTGGTASASAASAKKNTEITLTAVPDEGYRFAGWASSDVTITDRKSETATFVMPEKDVKVTASWTKDEIPEEPEYLIIVNSGDHGEISGSASPASAKAGEQVSLAGVTITPHTGYRFAGWTSDEVTVDDDGTFIMPEQDVTITASWTEDTGSDPDPGPNPPVDPTPAPGGGGGSGTPTAYPVRTAPCENGTVTASPKIAARGRTVAVAAAPDEGYELAGLTVTDSQGNEIVLTAQGADQYTFTMPGRPVTVTAAFAPSQDRPCDGGADCPSRAFLDLDAGKWYHEAVDYVLQNGLMSGYGGGRFGPDDPLSRAQLVRILYNEEGRPYAAGGGAFADVPDGKWYTTAINWAEANGIVDGYGSGQFGPNDSITREQLVVMLWRYAGSPAAADTELYFTDADSISGYALYAARWAAENGVMGGYSDGRLDPKGSATRAQAAQMLKDFLIGQK